MSTESVGQFYPRRRHCISPVTQGIRYSIVLFTPARQDDFPPHMWEEVKSLGFPTQDFTQHHFHAHFPSAISCVVPSPCHGPRAAPAATFDNVDSETPQCNHDMDFAMEIEKEIVTSVNATTDEIGVKAAAEANHFLRSRIPTSTL